MHTNYWKATSNYMKSLTKIDRIVMKELLCVLIVVNWLLRRPLYDITPSDAHARKKQFLHSFLQLTPSAISHYQFRVTYCSISPAIPAIPCCSACPYGLSIFNLFPAFDIVRLCYYFLWRFRPFLLPWRYYFNIRFILPLYSFLVLFIFFHA